MVPLRHEVWRGALGRPPLPARPGRVEIASTRFISDWGASSHDATAGAVRDGVRGHGGAHHDHPTAAVLRHGAGCQRDGGGATGLGVRGGPAGGGPGVGTFLRPLRPPARHPRRAAAHRLRLCHLCLRRIGVGAAPLPPGAGGGRRHDRGGAGVRGRCLAPRGAHQEPRLALGGDQLGRRGRSGVRVGDDQRGGTGGAGACRGGAGASGRGFRRALPGRVAPAPDDRVPRRPPPLPAPRQAIGGYSPTGTSRPRGSSGSTPSASGPSTAPSRSCRSCS